MLSADLDSIRDTGELVWQDVRAWTRDLSSSELAELGVTKRLSSTFRDSLEVLRGSSEIANLLGVTRKELYIQAKQQDEEAFYRMDNEQRRKRFIKYF